MRVFLSDHLCRLILPYQFRNVRLVTKCDIQSIIYRDGSFRRDGCIVSIDPIITIDPDQIVEIDGVEYPANEVYEIEYSEALLDLPGPESQPHIPLLLLDD